MRALIARFVGPTWGPSGADRTQVGPMLAPWTLLSGFFVTVTPTQTWSIPIITWLNNIVSNVYIQQDMFKTYTKLSNASTCLHCDVMHLSLIIAYKSHHLRVLETLQVCKTVWPVNAGRAYSSLSKYSMGNHQSLRTFMAFVFGIISHSSKHNYNETYRYWRLISIVMHATAQGSTLSFVRPSRTGKILKKLLLGQVVLLWHLSDRTGQ